MRGNEQSIVIDDLNTDDERSPFGAATVACARRVMGEDIVEVGPSIRVSTFGRFHEVARRHLRLMNEELAKLPPEPPFAGPDDDGPIRRAWEVWSYETAPIEMLADEHATITIVFACAACELYINDAGARLLGDTYYKKYLERFDLKAKWVLVPRLVAGIEVDLGSRAFQLLAHVIEARNDLMHPKSSSVASFEELVKRHETPSKRTRIEFAPDAIEALDRLGVESEKFDPKQQGRGLYDPDTYMERLERAAARLASQKGST